VASLRKGLSGRASDGPVLGSAAFAETATPLLRPLSSCHARPELGGLERCNTLVIRHARRLIGRR
jgi:hypothetical protein